MDRLKDTHFWIFLGALLAWLTFGVDGILWMICLATSFAIGVGFVLWKNGKYQCENWLLKQTYMQMSQSQTGLAQVTAQMAGKPSKKSTDRRLTGAGNIDEILNEILDYTCRDFIRSWYKRINGDTQFEADVRESIQHVIVAFSDRVKDVDLVPYLTTRFVDDFASHLRLYRQSLLLYRAQRGEEKREMEDLFFDLECEMERNLCRDLICMDEADERQYLEDLAEMMLFLLLPPEDFHNKIFRYIAREIVVNSILLPTINMITDPDYVNRMVSYWCKEGTFNSESFLTIIKASDSAEEMQAVKELVDADIARQRSKDTGGENDSQIKQQLSSLQYVKGLCESRLQQLSTGRASDMDIPVLVSKPAGAQPVTGQKAFQLPFDVLLNNNVSLNYFIEFMTSIGAQHYIFFYLNVEAYRVSAVQHISAYLVSESEGHHADLDTLKQLAANIFKQYLSDKNGVRSALDESMVKALWEKIEKEDPTDWIFDDVQAKIWCIMQSEPRFWPAFQLTARYAQMLQDIGLTKDGNGPSVDEPSGDNKSNSSLHGSRDDLSGLSGSSDDSLTSKSALSQPVVPVSQAPVTFTFSANIVRTGVSYEFGKAYGSYQVHCVKTMSDGTEESWDVPRRYSDFHDLHVIISEKYDTLPQLLMPGKKAFNSTSPDVLEKRKVGFNAYLQSVLNPSLLHSHRGLQDIVVKFFTGPVWDLKKFQQDLSPVLALKKGVASLMKSVPDSLNEVFSKAVVGEPLFGSPSKSSRPTIPRQTTVAAALDFERDDDIPLRVMLLLMDEVFDLRSSGNQWLRRRIAIILRQIAKTMYGDSMNRRIVEQVERMTSADQIAEYLKTIRDAIWPGGSLAESRKPRDASTRQNMRVMCKAKMYGTISDDLQRLIGAETCLRGVVLIFSMFQHQTLNKRLVYVVLERLLETLFPDNKFPQIFRKIHERSPRMTQQRSADKKL